MLVSPTDLTNLVELLIRTLSVLNSGSIGVHGKEWVRLGRLTLSLLLELTPHEITLGLGTVITP